MQKHWDVMFGVGGTASTITLTQVNAYLAFISGVITVFIVVVRARREWKHRNEPPAKKE